MSKANSKPRKKYGSKKKLSKDKMTPAAHSLSKNAPLLFKVPTLVYAYLLKAFCFLTLIMLSLTFCVSLTVSYLQFRVDFEGRSLSHSLPPVLISSALIYFVLRVSNFYSKWKKTLTRPSLMNVIKNDGVYFKYTPSNRTPLLFSTLFAISIAGVIVYINEPMLYVEPYQSVAYNLLFTSALLSFLARLPKNLIKKSL